MFVLSCLTDNRIRNRYFTSISRTRERSSIFFWMYPLITFYSRYCRWMRFILLDEWMRPYSNPPKICSYFWCMSSPDRPYFHAGLGHSPGTSTLFRIRFRISLGRREVNWLSPCFPSHKNVKSKLKRSRRARWVTAIFRSISRVDNFLPLTI